MMEQNSSQETANKLSIETSRSKSSEVDVAKRDALHQLDEILRQIQDYMGLVAWVTVVETFESQGLQEGKDPVLLKMTKKLQEMKPKECIKEVKLSNVEFKELMMMDYQITVPCLKKSLVIHKFPSYLKRITELFERHKDLNEGNIWNMFPDLWGLDPNAWGLSLMSIHGQRIDLGDSCSPFTLMDISSVILLGIGIEALGEDLVDSYIERENVSFTDELKLSKKCKARDPFNTIAMLIVCALLKNYAVPHMTDSQKHDYILSYIKAMTGGERLKFNNATYTEEKEKDCEVKAASRFLESIKRLHGPLEPAVDLLLQVRALEVCCQSLGVAAAVLANGGVSPITGNTVLGPNAVRALLKTMTKAGHGKESANFMFHIGLPGKSGKSGGTMIVIPGVLGMSLYSPKLINDISYRNFQFAKDWVEEFSYHPHGFLDKVERRPKVLKMPMTDNCDLDHQLFTLVAKGDVQAVHDVAALGLNIDKVVDCFGNNLLHVAAANGELKMVKLLHCISPMLLFKKDKWSKTPDMYATGEALEYLAGVKANIQEETLSAGLEKIKKHRPNERLSNNYSNISSATTLGQ